MFFKELASNFFGVGIKNKFIEENGVYFFLFVFAFVVDADERWVNAGADSWIDWEKYRGKWTKTYF